MPPAPGLGERVEGRSCLVERSSPAVANWADRAGGWLILAGLAAGLLAIVVGPRRGWAMVALGVEVAVAVALPLILGPGK